MRNLVSCLQDPSLVYRFQSYFGVVKLAEVEKDKTCSWVATEVKGKYPEIEKESTENHNGARSTKLKEESNGNGHVCAEDIKAKHSIVYYRITNKFWYHLFLLGSLLGHEAWYAFVYSFLFWNVDGSVGRRVMLVGNFLFYIGQGLKDVIRWPRPPMPPVVRLEQRWEAEYGMPSTHAMMALSLPMSVIIFTINTPFLWVWVTIGSFWCVVVCCCRLYLGMHSVADVLAGLGVAAFLLLFTIPIADYGDHFLLTSPLAPILTLTLSVLSIVYYPGSYKWTPARGETTYIIGGYFGTQLGCWLNYLLGIIHPPADISNVPLQPLLLQFFLGLSRVVLGLFCIGCLRALVKPVSFQIGCLLLQTDKQTLLKQEFHLKNKKKLVVDLFCKFVTFSAIGFGITFVSPLLFKLVGCDRPSYWTEMLLV